MAMCMKYAPLHTIKYVCCIRDKSTSENMPGLSLKPQDCACAAHAQRQPASIVACMQHGSIDTPEKSFEHQNGKKQPGNTILGVADILILVQVSAYAVHTTPHTYYMMV